MRLLVLRYRGPREAVDRLAESIESGLSPLSVATFDEGAGHWALEALLEAPPPEPALAQALSGSGLRASDLDLAPLPDRDWVAESLKGLAPVRAGRFFVHGAHDRGKAPAGAVAIEIEAARAFGTGHHATTWGCLIAMSDLARRLDRPAVLDLGTGTGALAIAAANLWKKRVIAGDIDPLAVRITHENARANAVAPSIEAVVGDGTRNRRIAECAPYDLVLANILAGPLVRLAPDIAALLAPGGVAVLSGLLEGQVREVLAAYRARGLTPARRVVADGWATLVLARHAGRPPLKCNDGGRCESLRRGGRHAAPGRR